MQLDLYTLLALLIGIIGGIVLLTALALDLRGEFPRKRSRPGGPDQERHQAGEPSPSRYEKAGRGA